MNKNDASWARVGNLVLGGWLLVSAFAWPHAPAQRVNAAIVGLLVFASALAAVTSAQMRHANTALGAWLFVSTLALPGPATGTEWNNVVVAAAIFCLSLIGPPRRERRIVLHASRTT
jgi:hypothetical protein